MPLATGDRPVLEFQPVSPERWPDLVRFGADHGNFGWCWCMRWRLTSTEFRNSTKASRRAALEKRVAEETPVGVLGYLGGEPLAWCSIAQRETYAALERSKVLARVDDVPVWPVVCFLIDRTLRRQGVTPDLLRAAVDYARAQGARAVEGYPVEDDIKSYDFMGSTTTFRLAGFRDVNYGQTGRRLMRVML